jgi:hypothetical protein
VVTLSAPYGAGGSFVGPKLAAALGVPFLDRAIPVAVSERLEIPPEEAVAREEVPQNTLSRWMIHFAPAVQLFGGAPIPYEVAPGGDDAFRAATEEVLREYAANGGVLLGRAGAIVLAGDPGALHVRLDGAKDDRARQAMRMLQIDREEADRELSASDLAREAYVRSWYRADPADPRHYHLVLDSTRLSLDTCVELVVLAVGSR